MNSYLGFCLTALLNHLFSKDLWSNCSVLVVVPGNREIAKNKRQILAIRELILLVDHRLPLYSPQLSRSGIAKFFLKEPENTYFKALWAKRQHGGYYVDILDKYLTFSHFKMSKPFLAWGHTKISSG